MEESIVSLKVARLARNKGFNWKTCFCYENNKLTTPLTRINGREYSPIYSIPVYNPINWNKYPEHIYSAPTQDLLVKWLRDVHNTIVIINPKVFGFSFSPGGLKYSFIFYTRYKVKASSQERYYFYTKEIKDISLSKEEEAEKYPWIGKEFDTYEEALDFALLTVLDYIK